MIRFTLKCDREHIFDSWFQSGAAYHALQLAGHVSCAQCGSAVVEKTLMSPAVSDAAARPLAPSDVESDVAKLQREVEAKSDYVGLQFAAQARAMHDGDTPHRAIYGEATGSEARALIEDGVPVAPLPFVPRRKVN